MSANFPEPPFTEQQQPMPGSSSAMEPQPDYGESSYRGCGRLAGKKTIITGGDSGIGRAVALAFAREGADVLISYYNEDADAKETQRLVEDAGRRCVLMPGDIKDPEHCRAIVSTAISKLGSIDVLVNNAAHQASFSSLTDITDEEWDVTFRTNVHAMFYLTKAAVAHMQPGAAVINTTSINADAQPTTACLRDDEGRNPEFHSRIGSAIGRKRYPGELCGAGANLDALNPVHHAGREGEGFRQAGADAAPGTAQGACAGLCHACGRRSQLRVRCDGCGDRRQANIVNVAAR